MVIFSISRSLALTCMAWLLLLTFHVQLSVAFSFVIAVHSTVNFMWYWSAQLSCPNDQRSAVHFATSAEASVFLLNVYVVHSWVL